MKINKPKKFLQTIITIFGTQHTLNYLNTVKDLCFLSKKTCMLGPAVDEGKLANEAANQHPLNTVVNN